MATNLKATNNNNEAREAEFDQIQDANDKVRKQLQQEFKEKMEQGRKMKFENNFEDGD